jgi:hypothetical protein
MIIPIKQNIENKYYIIELQGQLVTKNLEIGEFNNGYLSIGNHLLQGKKQKCCTLVVYKKDGLQIKEIIREKWVFSNRPEHIINV